jgi:hypothetical protein
MFSSIICVDRVPHPGHAGPERIHHVPPVPGRHEICGRCSHERPQLPQQGSFEGPFAEKCYDL